MSRWVPQFVLAVDSWREISKEITELAVTEESVTINIGELARLKKVAVYLDTLLSGIDPDLTPRGVWETFTQQADQVRPQIQAYKNNRNIAHIVEANNLVDNLLTYARPYTALSESVNSALLESAQASYADFGYFVNGFKAKSDLLVSEIDEARVQALDQLRKINSNAKKIDSFSDRIFSGVEGEPAIETAIGEALTDAQKKSDQIRKFHSQMFEGDEPIVKKVNDAATAVSETKNKINEEHKAVQIVIDKLTAFSEKIFGRVGSDGEGLEAELTRRAAQITKIEGDQELRFGILFKKIESLLPGATSAGLASSYGALKDSFNRPIALYTVLFYGSLLLLVVAALIISVDSLSLYPIFTFNYPCRELGLHSSCIPYSCALYRSCNLARDVLC